MADEKIDLTDIAKDFRFKAPPEHGVSVSDGKTWEDRNESGDSRGARFRRTVRSFVMGNLGGGGG